MKAYNFYQQNPEEYCKLIDLLIEVDRGLTPEGTVHEYLLDMCEKYNLDYDDLSDYSYAEFGNIGYEEGL